ncbi:MAG: hypothetical protein V7K71_13245 [Nostoc sp.]
MYEGWRSLQSSLAGLLLVGLIALRVLADKLEHGEVTHSSS